jgi:nitroreductase
VKRTKIKIYNIVKKVVDIMLDMLKRRRSIRKYKETLIEKEIIEELLKAGILAPTSKNSKSWEFIAVDDKEILKEISGSRENGAARFLANSPLGIVILGNEEKSDVWVEDACIAGAFIQLQAESMGLGSCWIQVRNRMYSESETTELFIKNLMDIPEKYRVECIISVGYPGEVRKIYEDSDLKFEKIHFNKL